MKYSTIIVSTLILTSVITSCKKEGCTDPSATNYDKKAKKDNGYCEYAADHKEILKAIGTNVVVATYNDLANNTSSLYDAVNDFIANPSAAKLDNCRNLWKFSRSSWECSEGFLFGPVATEEIDPRIDTWPVDYNAMETLLSGSTDFTVDANIDALDDALKGFHPIEYILWGANGTKTYSDFTLREKEYLKALAKNVKKLTSDLVQGWNVNASGSFYTSFTAPGPGNTFYPTTKSVFEELVNGIAGICDEVANGKISEPFTQHNPSLEESPYSQNSIKDFTDNIRSVENIYMGKYTSDGQGLENLVRAHNLSLDNTIKTKISNAITKIQAITDPFGTAITSQATLVQNAINAINDLKSTLEGDLLLLVQQYVTD
ncbi:imelysin family protein [Fluviicola sp.]|jgi:predicted lipoprotein|uniref:imelysin family protein n=1 Tax=Fluviicola sp. TaxID=1917219 RepID=UPI00282C14B1|nr:imelysin family protein [Fluviicola sp.]MDR0801559.1 imelysin [Fluviicola sp.]